MDGFDGYSQVKRQWHISFETYNLHQNNVPNAGNSLCTNANGTGLWDMGGTPFSPQYMPFNSPSLAQCNSAAVLSCTASVQTYLAYLSYKASPMDNISYRIEFYDDKQGQRTGIKTRYVETGIAWHHWLSPPIQIHPELPYYPPLSAPAF